MERFKSTKIYQNYILFDFIQIDESEKLKFSFWLRVYF